jgi:hypothetical protein
LRPSTTTSVPAVDGRIKRHAGYKVSLKVRKRIEEAFG